MINGAGAAGIACVELIKAMGMPHDNVILCDTQGVIWQGRPTGMNQWKSAHAVPTEARTLADAMRGADVVMGLSAKGAFTPDDDRVDGRQADHLRHGQPRPRDHARGGRARSAPTPSSPPAAATIPNQVNNVLGFPYIFRGALDVRASTINEAMKIAAAHAIAALAREEVPDEVTAAYRGRRLRYGPEYLIPTPFDPRLISAVPVGGRQGGDGDRRGAPADRQPRALPAGAAEPPRPDRQPDAADHRPGPGAAQARRVRRRRGGEEHQRRARLAQSAGSARRC